MFSGKGIAFTAADIEYQVKADINAAMNGIVSPADIEYPYI